MAESRTGTAIEPVTPEEFGSSLRQEPAFMQLQRDSAAESETGPAEKLELRAVPEEAAA